MLAVNDELIRLYWQIGELLAAQQAREGWGAGVIPRLSVDLHNELPEVKGFSERNIGLMLQFYRTYPALFDAAMDISQPPAAKLPRSAVAPPKAPSAVARKNRVLAEYALRGIDKPIGIADYDFTRALPESLESALPSIEDLEAEPSKAPEPDREA